MRTAEIIAQTLREIADALATTDTPQDAAGILRERADAIAAKPAEYVMAYGQHRDPDAPES